MNIKIVCRAIGILSALLIASLAFGQITPGSVTSAASPLFAILNYSFPAKCLAIGFTQ